MSAQDVVMPTFLKAAKVEADLGVPLGKQEESFLSRSMVLTLWVTDALEVAYQIFILQFMTVAK